MSARPPESPDLGALLEPILGRATTITPLSAGTSGRSFRVDAAGGPYAAKLFDAGAQVLLGPAQQYDLLVDLADYEIAPRPIAFDADEGLLVVEFVEQARAISRRALRAPERIDQVAQALSRLHRVPIELRPYRPAEHAEAYVSGVGGLDALAHRDRERFLELLDLAASLDDREASLCHNDLTADNLLFGSSVVLIDFDYAVSAPPIVDLASLAVLNGFESEAIERLLGAYSQHGDRFTATEFA